MTESQILQVLKEIIDPDFQRDIVDLGFVRNIRIESDGVVELDLVLTTPACPVKDQFRDRAIQLISALPGVREARVHLKAQSAPPRKSNEKSLLTHVRHIVAVASGKGGVGKSTVTANLAMTLALSGARVGILDADIYGPSMGIMFGITEDPEIREDRTLVPVSVAGIQIVSMSMLSDPNKATIWRGPMATQMINNFLHRVHWGHLDYLLIDFPPGTGDIQLTLTQSCPLSGAVVVTTPQQVALADVRKGLSMFRSVAVPVLGVIENMSWFICDGCGKKHFILRQGGGARITKELDIPLLGEIPLEPGVADSGDLGRPIVYAQPNSVSAQCFAEITGTIARRLAVLEAHAGQIGHLQCEFEELPLALPEHQNSSESTRQASPIAIYRTTDDLLAIRWSSGDMLVYEHRALRLACPCAACVDEWTRKPLLDPASVPADIRIAQVYTVGRYALGISFSDGHKSGIYPWETLRRSGSPL